MGINLRPLMLAAIALVAIGCGADNADVTSQDDGASQPVAAPEAPAEHGDESAHDDAADADEDAATSEDALVVEVEMNDFGYEPSSLSVPVGVPVRLLFTNVGVIEHEAMVGDAHEQDEFEADGHDGEHGDSHHGDIQAITLQPGESGHLDVVFAESAELMLGCHLPGHWDAGMKADLVVS